MKGEALESMDATTAAIVIAAGLLLIYVEMCRPGWILPGALGAALAMLGTAKLWDTAIPQPAAWAAAAGFALAVAETWLRWPGIPGLASAIAFAWAASRIQPAPLWKAAAAFAMFQAVTSATVVLGSAAIRSYTLKRVDP